MATGFGNFKLFDLKIVQSLQYIFKISEEVLCSGREGQDVTCRSNTICFYGKVSPGGISLEEGSEILGNDKKKAREI